MRARMSKVDWSKQSPVMMYMDCKIYVHRDLEPGHFFVSNVNDVIVMGRETWATLGHDSVALHGVLRDMALGTDGMRFINVQAAGPYRDAARQEATDVKTDVIHAKDAITLLTERCNKLIVNAAGLINKPTDLQLRIFWNELAEIDEELDRVRAEFKRLEATVELAKTAVAAA